MTDLYQQIEYFNPTHAEAITAFIDDNEKNHHDAIIDLECDIHDFDCCVVGEIHNFDGSYALWGSDEYCGKCQSLANELAVRYSDNDRSLFAELLVDLYNHIRQVDHKVSDE